MQPCARRCKYPETCGSYVEPPQRRSRRLPVIGKVSGEGTHECSQVVDQSRCAAVCVVRRACCGSAAKSIGSCRPIPAAVVSADGRRSSRAPTSRPAGRSGNRSAAMQLGSIWGHGSYVAPDWTADWLHREAVAWLDLRRAARGVACLTRSSRAERTGGVARRVCSRGSARNTYDAATRPIVRSRPTAPAPFANVAAHYTACSATIRRCAGLREAYAMKEGTVRDAEHRTRADRLLLVDRVGGRRPSGPARHDHLHQQLAARAARRQHAAADTC